MPNDPGKYRVPILHLKDVVDEPSQSTAAGAGLPQQQQVQPQVDGVIPNQYQQQMQQQVAPQFVQAQPQSPQPEPAKKGFSIFGRKKGVIEEAVSEAIITPAYETHGPTEVQGTEIPIPQNQQFAPQTQQFTPPTQQPVNIPQDIQTPTPQTSPTLTIPAAQNIQPTPAPVVPPVQPVVEQPAPVVPPVPPVMEQPQTPVPPTPVVPPAPVAEIPVTPPAPLQAPASSTQQVQQTIPTPQEVDFHTQDQDTATGVFEIPKEPLSQQPREFLEAIERDSQREEALAGEATRELDDVLASQFAIAREQQLEQMANTQQTPPVPAPEELQQVTLPPRPVEQIESLPPVIQPKEIPPHVVPLPQAPTPAPVVPPVQPVVEQPAPVVPPVPPVMEQPQTPVPPTPVVPPAPVAEIPVTPPAPLQAPEESVDNLISSLSKRKDEINMTISGYQDGEEPIDSSSGFGTTSGDDGPPDIWELAAMRKSGKAVAPPQTTPNLAQVAPTNQTAQVVTQPVAVPEQQEVLTVNDPTMRVQQTPLPRPEEETSTEPATSALDEITYNDGEDEVYGEEIPDDVPEENLVPENENTITVATPEQKAPIEDVAIHLEIENANTKESPTQKTQQPAEQVAPNEKPTSNLEALRKRAQESAQDEQEHPHTVAGAEPQKRPKPTTQHAKAIANIADKLSEIQSTPATELPSIKSIIEGDIDAETASKKTKEITGTGNEEGALPTTQGIPLVRTFRNDVEQAVVKNKTSVGDMLEREKNRNYGETIRTAKHSNSSTISLILVWASVILVLGAVAFGVFVLFNFLTKNRNTDTPEIVSPNEIVLHDITNQTKTEILEGLTSIGATLQASQNSVTELQIVEGESGTRIVETYSFFGKLNTNAPSSLIRSTDEDMAIGFHKLVKGEPFWAFKVTDFEAASGGMYEWEDTLRKDLSPLFGRVVEVNVSTPSTTVSASSTSTTTTQVTTGTTQRSLVDVYTDTTVANVPARCLKGTGDQQDTCILLWSMPDKETVVITSNTDTLRTLIDRMKARTN